MINTKKHLAYILKFDQREIDAILENIERFYGEKINFKLDKFNQPKLDASGNPKKRIINPSKRRLKVLQKRINKNVLSKIKIPDYAFGAVKGKSNITNAKQHQGKKYKFTTDLKDFFPSISHKSVFQMFLKNGFSPSVARILTQLTTYKGKIPQGAPTSSTIANLVFIETGDALQKLSSNYGLTFTSFVDDMTFSSKEDFKGKIPEILDIITSQFRISHKKTNYSRNPNVTGLHPMNNHLQIPKSFQEKLQNLHDKTPEQREGILLYKGLVDKTNYS